METSSIPVTLIETNVTTASSTYGADYYVRQLIQANKSTQSEVTSFYKEVLRFLLRQFSSYKVVNSHGELIDVKCVHGIQERAIAKQLQSDTLKLPLMSISLTSSESIAKQWHFNSKISTESYWDNIKQRAIRVVSLAPKPVTLEYVLKSWTTYVEQLDQLSEQLQRTFNPFIELSTPYTEYGAVSLQSDFLEAESEISSGEDRLLVRSYKINVETHIPSPKYLMTSTGQLERINIEVQSDSD